MADDTRRQKHAGWGLEEWKADTDDSLDEHDRNFADLKSLLLKVAFTVATAVTGLLTALIQLKKG